MDATTQPRGSADPSAPDRPGAAMKIDIWSDVACPWCFIGKRRFEAGLARFVANGAGDGRAVEIEYHSYELSPDAPADLDVGELDYLAQHLGVSRDQGAAMLAQMTDLGRSVGIEFDFGALRHANTARAHQLLHFAKSRGRAAEAYERLFRAYFSEGRHLGWVAELADLAAELGLDRAAAERSLAADEFLADVRADEALARELGVQGVPFFVVDGRYGISGAREPAVFEQALERVWAELAAR